MPRTLQTSTVSSQSTSVDAREPELSTAVDRALALLRNAVHDCGWTLDALAAHMRRDKSLISRVLNGERPLTQEFICALPDDVEGLYESRRAEQFGAVVVQPLSGQDALKALVAGLIGVMSAPQLPARAAAMVKVELPAARKVAVNE